MTMRVESDKVPRMNGKREQSGIKRGNSSVPAAPSLTHRLFALISGVVTALCATLFSLTYAFVAAQVVAVAYDNPLLLFIVTALTFPPAIVFTSIAMLLVGPRHCKLAWISLSFFAIPFNALFHWMLNETIAGIFK
jgi:putative exporter of polyketide antibiotics